MKTRVISGIFLVIILFGLLYFGGYVLLAALLLMSLIGTSEYNKALNQAHRPFIFLPYGATIAYYILLAIRPEWITDTPLGFYLMIIAFLVFMVCTVFVYPNRRFEDAVLSFTGIIYISIMFSFLFFLRNRENGFLYSWFVFIASWVSDTCAYFAGRFLGKHKLVPRLSPKKTVEGAIGGVLGSMILCVVYGLLIQNYLGITTQTLVILCLLVGGAGAILSQIGDLYASSIKRFVGIKDYGKLIPGHGGILDRFDSVLLAGPAVALVIMILI